MINQIIEIADIHLNKIHLAIDRTKHLFPINAKLIENLSDDDFVWIELLIVRFGKLQDLIGAKLINIFLQTHQENIEKLTMLDKLNLMERFAILDTKIWKEIRRIRKNIAHDYPNSSEITAVYLNRICELIPYLENILNKIKEKLL